MNIVLFALTGIGNSVLRALVEIGRRPVLVVTRKENGAYPYYDEAQLALEASKLEIPVLFGEDGERETAKRRPDVILSATYHRLIPNEVISSAAHAFNLHPSLLPSYPGKNPFYWALINGESVTGVSIHRLTDKFDTGELLLQKATKIRADETQGSLRFALAQLAGEAVKELFIRLDSANISSVLSRSLEGRRFGQVSDTDRIIDVKNNAEMICRQVRALTPWPRGILREAGGTVQRIISIDRKANSDASPGTMLSIDETTAKVRVADAEITFSIDRKTKVEKHR